MGRTRNGRATGVARLAGRGCEPLRRGQFDCAWEAAGLTVFLYSGGSGSKAMSARGRRSRPVRCKRFVLDAAYKETPARERLPTSPPSGRVHRLSMNTSGPPGEWSFRGTRRRKAGRSPGPWNLTAFPEASRGVGREASDSSLRCIYDVYYVTSCQASPTESPKDICRGRRDSGKGIAASQGEIFLYPKRFPRRFASLSCGEWGIPRKLLNVPFGECMIPRTMHVRLPGL